MDHLNLFDICRHSFPANYVTKDDALLSHQIILLCVDPQSSSFQSCQDKLSELDFHIWNPNWLMKCEAKMAANGGQFYTSVLVLYAGLYVSFSLARNFSTFLYCSLKSFV